MTRTQNGDAESDGGDRKPDTRSTSRRDFFRAAGIGAAGLAVGGAATAAATGALSPHEDLGFTPLKRRSEPGFDHVVVIMFENRSFDHLLGRLYADGGLRAGQTFAGIDEATHSNPGVDGQPVFAHVFTGATDEIMAQPDPDPGEFYPHVNTQLFGRIDPATNADPRVHGLRPPWNAPAEGGEPTMDGFVKDYAVNYTLTRGRAPTAIEAANVMGGFSPEMLPVLSTLARNFGVYDHWFAAVPSQTFCNRSFLHASTSHGFVTNAEGSGIDKWLSAPAVPTIFDRLEQAGLRWRVYYDEKQVVSLTGFLSAPSIERYWKSNFRSMEQFHQDAADGNLPDYAFVEPRMVFDHNDMHPPVSKIHHNEKSDTAQPAYEAALSDLRAGELLLAEVYTSIKEAASDDGSNAMNTALVVTFDEHGGLYDHVPPPSAAPPSGKPVPGEMGFAFDRLGLRVPAIVVSAYTQAGTVINEPMHHGSVAKTLAQLHGLKPLTRRDEEATSIVNAINLTTPRQPALWPTVGKPYVPPNPEAHPESRIAQQGERPLTPPALGLLGIMLAKYEPNAPKPENFADAYAILKKHGDGLFGTRD